jgi:hypothetical protein
MDKLSEQLFKFRLMSDGADRIISIIRVRDTFVITTEWNVYIAEDDRYGEGFNIRRQGVLP